MSKNITIAEGGQAKTFTNVSHLKTNLIGGGTQYWVPEDEAGEYANVDEITITENGTYSARDEDLDGFSTVRVNVSGGGGDEPVLVTKNITANGTYNASGDGADGYSSVTVNVQATHGRTIVNGLNNAPVSQRISTRDFFDDLNEQAYAAGMSYFTRDDMKAKLQSYLREGGWLNSAAPDIFNYNNLVLVGAAGICHGDMYGYLQLHIWVWMVGIMDESGIVTLSNLTLNSLAGTLSDGSKFTNSNGGMGVTFNHRGGSMGNQGYTYVKQDIDNHIVGSSGQRSVSHSESYNVIFDDYPHTPIITNLTGGTIA